MLKIHVLDRQTDRQIDKQTDIKIYENLTDRQTDRVILVLIVLDCNSDDV